MELVEPVLDELRLRDLASVPVIAGGIIPLEDATKLAALGVSAVYTPKDFSFNTIMADMVDVIRAANGLGRLGPLP